MQLYVSLLAKWYFYPNETTVDYCKPLHTYKHTCIFVDNDCCLLGNWMAWCKTCRCDFFGWNFFLQKWLNFLKRAKKEKSFVVSVHCAPFNILCSFFIFEGQKLSPEKVTFVSLAPSHSIVRMILPPLVWPSRRNFFLYLKVHFN